MAGLFNRFQNFPRHQVTITPSDSAGLKTDMIIVAGAAGTITVLDDAGTSIQYTLEKGDMLPFLAVKVMATGTSMATIYGYY
jgi:CRP-like cAMP-binding protein